MDAILLIQNGSITSLDELWGRFPVVCAMYLNRLEKCIRIQNKLRHKTRKVHVRINVGDPGVGKTTSAYVTFFH